MMPADLPVILRVLPAGGAQPRWPLHGAQASRRVEQQAAAQLPAHTLMRRAGLAVARLARAVAPHARRVWVAAGPGNNGGDGFEAAMHLHLAGLDVQVTACGDPGRLPADAAAALARARAAGVAIAPPGAVPPLQPHDLVVDALLGLGASRPPEGILADTIAAINRCSAACLAIDLPSGLPSDTGHLTTGEPQACVRARHTLSLLTLKPGLFTAQGRDQAGSVWFCDLGVGLAGQPCDAWLAGADALQTLPPRRHTQHKGSFGNVAIIGGAAGMTGAALLAARAALHHGAGRVFVQLLDGSGMAVDPQSPELMFRPRLDWQGGPGQTWTAVCGCGGGTAVRAELPEVLARAAQLVLDADALNAVATDPGLQALLARRGTRTPATVLTPHPLEAARLLDVSVAQIQGDRLAHAGLLARRFGAVVLLKGSGTVVAAPEGPPSINPTGSAALGTAGTGDVLAGWIGALLAQGAAPQAAAIAAAYAHGAASDSWCIDRPGSTLVAGALTQSL